MEKFIVIVWQLQFIFTTIVIKSRSHGDYDYLPDSGNYTCDEIFRWIGTEKHYSNAKKENLFRLIKGNQKCNNDAAVSLPFFLSDISYGLSGVRGERQQAFFTNIHSNRKCKLRDEKAVAYLSNYSINNNYSHFLHGLLRLFCSLIDARWIIWNSQKRLFSHTSPYAIWLDEYFKLNAIKAVWLQSLSPYFDFSSLEMNPKEPLKRMYRSNKSVNSVIDRNNILGIRQLGFELQSAVSTSTATAATECITATELLYGSGCVRLYAPEKWYGYSGCRAAEIAPAFGSYFRQIFNISSVPDKIYMDTMAEFESSRGYKSDSNVVNQMYNRFQNNRYNKGRMHNETDFLNIEQQQPYHIKTQLKIQFVVRSLVGDKTGRREISNLQHIQNSIFQHNSFNPNDSSTSSSLSALNMLVSKSLSLGNISFEKLSPIQTVREMSETHILISVHGAALTNIFFMKPGTAVIEIIPYPLCDCISPDYFYGDGGYYHGMALALNIKHYSYCVPKIDTMWHQKPKNIDDFDSNNKSINGNNNVRCSWKYLHNVQSVKLNKNRFISLLRRVQRELIAAETILISSPIINLNPHVNG